MTYNICTSQVLPKVYTTIHRYSRNPDGWKPDLCSYILHTAYAFGCQFGQTDHSPLFIAFWIHNFSNSPVCTFSTLFYAKIMYYYKELLKAINAILLQLTLLYFFPKKHGFFGNFHEILIWKILFFSIFATFSWKNP